jgi:hypothetical protein
VRFGIWDFGFKKYKPGSGFWVQGSKVQGFIRFRVLGSKVQRSMAQGIRLKAQGKLRKAHGHSVKGVALGWRHWNAEGVMWKARITAQISRLKALGIH